MYYKILKSIAYLLILHVTCYYKNYRIQQQVYNIKAFINVYETEYGFKKPSWVPVELSFFALEVESVSLTGVREKF